MNQLQLEIIKNGGFILSDGTLNMQHLLPKAYDVIHNLRMEETSDKAKTILAEILDCFVIDPEDLPYIQAHGLFSAQYYSRVSLKDGIEASENISWLWNEDIYNLFQDLSPSGYSFGSSEGDGACIGWFKYESDEEETEEEEGNEE